MATPVACRGRDSRPVSVQPIPTSVGLSSPGGHQHRRPVQHRGGPGSTARPAAGRPGCARPTVPVVPAGSRAARPPPRRPCRCRRSGSPPPRARAPASAPAVRRRSPAIGADELDVHPVREAAPDRARAGGRRSSVSIGASVTQARCGLPTSTASPAKLRRPIAARRWPRRRRPVPCRPRSRRRPARTARTPPRVPSAQLGAVEPAAVGQVAGEHPDPVAAHLGDAAVGVAVVHEPLDARLRRRAVAERGPAHHPQHAVGTQPAAPVAERGHPAGVSSSSPSGSGSSTKSFSVPCPLANCTPADPTAYAVSRRSSGTGCARSAASRPGRAGPGRRRPASGSGGRGGTRTAAGGRTGGWPGRSRAAASVSSPAPSSAASTCW